MEKLLETTIGQHGYWLGNNLDIIREELQNKLRTNGHKETARLLDDYNSPFVRSLYKKIKANR